MDVINKSGQARTASSPILRTAFLQLDQAGRSGPNPFTCRSLRQAAIVADLTKAGFRVKQNYIGDNMVFVARVKDNKGGPMFSFSWGYYSVFDADAILHDIFKCKETYSYYCNPAMDDLIVQGRSTLD